MFVKFFSKKRLRVGQKVKVNGRTIIVRKKLYKVKNRPRGMTEY